MTIASFIRAVARLTPQWTVLAGTTLVLGQTALAEDMVSVLMKQRLADMTGKEATVLTVDYAPGTASEPHVHPGSVFAYVLEGAVVAQVLGDGVSAEERTYHVGEMFYEPIGSTHQVSKNASQTEPARLLAINLAKKEGS